METLKRIDYLDIMKGIGLLLVVWAHARGTYTSYINQFHMPLFFLVSGFLYSDKKSVKDFIISKVRSLYLPFVTWNLIGTILLVYFGFIQVKDSFHYINIILTLEKNGKLFGATWFLGALFVISILYRLLDYVLYDIKCRHSILLIFFSLLALCGLEHNFDYLLSRTMICSFFFATGNIIKIINLPEISSNKKLLVVFYL